MPTLTPTPVPSLYPGEVTQYQNQSLTPINGFISEFLSTSIAGAQYVNLTTYRLIVTGLVNQTQEYTYDDVVNKFSARQQVVTLLCVAGWGADVLWKGVSVNDILQASGVSPQADTLIFYASDGYSTSLPLSYVVENNLMLAYKMNNVTLTPQTGFPFMLVAQNQYGYKWIKWVTEIDVSNNANYLGYWESRGYPNDATISNPSSLMPNTAGSTAVISVLYGGGTIMAGATYFTLTNLNNKRSKFQKNNDKAD
jgi:DMSO/TMAO reductase YedYZ molybdopterin-dependent catalytic subunit